MRDEQKRIQSYRYNKKIDACIRLYNSSDSFKKIIKGDILKDFNTYVSQVEANISENTLKQIEMFKHSNGDLANTLGVHKDKIRRKKESIRKQFKPIIEANRNFLELFI